MALRKALRRGVPLQLWAWRDRLSGRHRRFARSIAPPRDVQRAGAVVSPDRYAI